MYDVKVDNIIRKLGRHAEKVQVFLDIEDGPMLESWYMGISNHIRQMQELSQELDNIRIKTFK